MPDQLIIIRQPSSLRKVTQAEVRNAIPEELIRLLTSEVVVDMEPFGVDINNGSWDSSESLIIQKAQEIKKLSEKANDPTIHYFGLAEVPHIVALGAYVSDLRRVEVHDLYSEEWIWPEGTQTVQLGETKGIPSEVVKAPGEAILRVEVTYRIKDDDVDAVVSKGRLADITVGLEDIRPGIVKSREDAEAIRTEVRKALSRLLEHRPGIERIHLFCAAPASVCFLVGQELRLRNGVPVVTYRHRYSPDGPNIREAMTLTPGEATIAAEPLSDEDVKQAQEIRSGAWPSALGDVVRYARTLEGDHGDRPDLRWYDVLQFRDQAAEARPFPMLSPLWELVNKKSTVNPSPLPGTDPPYALPKTSWEWQLTDPLLLAQRRAALDDTGSIDEDLLARLIRLFLFHESLHEHHVLTKYTAEGVGRFPNCLERIDYMADLFASLHQLDFTARYVKDLHNDEDLHDELKQVLDDVLRSHWAFVESDEKAPRWQVRHIRRFLNWYWRWVQVVRADTLATALRVLAEPPAIEVAGLEQQVEGRRVFARLDRRDPRTEFSLGLVTENAQLLKMTNSTTLNLEELMEAFAQRDHESIKSFFQAVFEAAQAGGGGLPE